METILSEEKLMKWLDLSPWKLAKLAEQGLPVIKITRETRFFSKQQVTKWILVQGTHLQALKLQRTGVEEG